MVKSMTGYGKADYDSEEAKVLVEIKSVNSKFFDLNIKLPRVISDKEIEIRSVFQKKVGRGKLSVLIEISHLGVKNPNFDFIDEHIFDIHFMQLKKMSAKYNDTKTNLFAQTLRFPKIFAKPKSQIDKHLHLQINNIIDEALKKFDESRLLEGSKIQDDITTRIQIIENQLKKIKEFEETRRKEFRKRLEENMAKHHGIDATNTERFEQEVFYYIEKMDITEEQVRLKAHCNYFLKTLTEPSSGKKLVFIIQEISRESNTIGAKANFLNIQKIIVEIKNEIEKIKEQLANVL